MKRVANSQSLKDILVIILATCFITLAIWIPHFFALKSFYFLDFSNGFSNIYRNFDGLEYVIIAKSLYDPQIIASLPQSLPDIYYAAHFPGYAVLILTFAPLLGFLKSMLFVSLIFTILSTIAFYFLVKNFRLSDNPLFLSLLFLILPARWLVTHSVGSAEPVFIFFIILALYFFMEHEQSFRKSSLLLCAIFGGLAQFTRPPGALLFIALSLYILWKTFKTPGNIFTNLLQSILKYLPLLLIPLSLVGVFAWYHFSYGDFFAYFKTGDNVHLVFPPFRVFNKSDFWVGDIWLEDLVYIYLIGFLSGITLIKQKLYPLAFFVLTYLTASIFITHRDISRYIIPITPFVLISFEKVLTSKEFKIVIAITALGIYLYAQNFIIENVAPFPNVDLFN